MNELEPAAAPTADPIGNACACLTPSEYADLLQAARILANSGSVLTRVAGFVGSRGEWLTRHTGGLGRHVFGEGWQQKLQGMTEGALARAYGVATLGMRQAEPMQQAGAVQHAGGDQAGDSAPRMRFNKAMVGLSGAAGGFFGMPGLAVDIPASTMMMMRSIAEIARAHGEDITSEAGRRACLEVFAMGGPGTADDAAEISYWSTRAALNHATVATALRVVARSFGVVLSEKLLAQAVPVAGAAAGGALNWLFMDFYQQMARVHFTVRRVEREVADPSSVRPCFDRLVAYARGRAVTPGEPGPAAEPVI
jgi:hypothetical protein